ncbi:MAG: hypothetical protein JWN69_640 [Alphaproteobacteria bacterium]|nr:hypothetical protein [Alphaproteobacteria bacterium]
MFLLNHWYVAGFAADLTDLPLGRAICGKPIVFFRDEDGVPAAVEDRCIHRGMPLSQGGTCERGVLRCPYHGLEFVGSGACVKIPGQDFVPEAARLAAYPAAEQDALLWVWPGDPAKADTDAIPRHSQHVDPSWTWSTVTIEIAADWQLLNDNLLDLTHLGFVHRNTIGGNPNAHSNAVMRTSKTEKGVLVTRWLPDSLPPPHYRQAGAFAGNIDRWQEIDFLPGLIRIWSGGVDVGTGAYEGRREGGVQFIGMHAVTPASDTSCTYHFSQARNFGLADRALGEKLHESGLDTLLEDKVILEAQQARLLATPGRPLVDIRSDAGGIQARKIIRRLWEQEHGDTAPARMATA